MSKKATVYFGDKLYKKLDLVSAVYEKKVGYEVSKRQYFLHLLDLMEDKVKEMEEENKNAGG